MTDQYASGDQSDGHATAAGGALRVPAQSPFFRALQADRYQRQDQIRAIEQHTGRRLICYVSGPAALVNRDDIPPLYDLLQDVHEGNELDFLVHTMGGDVDAAERIVLLLYKTIGTKGKLRVIVPDSAKSAGTLIAVAGDSIVMGPPSELGPIDPQVIVSTLNGQQLSRPAQSYLDGLTHIIKQTEGIDLPTAYVPLLEKFDPALIDVCRKALNRSQKFAERFLAERMLRDQPDKVTLVAGRLNDNKQWLSHGAVINCDGAAELGLTVEYLPTSDLLWQSYWRLYCETKLQLSSPYDKIFESNYASLHLTG
jgi:ClpP class serine protease